MTLLDDVRATPPAGASEAARPDGAGGPDARAAIDTVTGSVVLFTPAHNEERTVARVVARAPHAVRGHPVEVIVVDDGSDDATALEARWAGAEVISLGRNLGLGAAVRVGLATAAARDAVAVAFLDADEEYAPEELERLVGPILDGDADYVVGSRFRGDIQSMRPHRRFGNQVLTRVLRRVARTPISDGQSGYRALSAAAAADAEVIHDFNYAQVLTLDLLAKGYRYLEVPITYRFRTEGKSFVRLLPYLRRVVPAVWRELRQP
jgi:glycosyltransferase involved in cell wall biosynthesis